MDNPSAAEVAILMGSYNGEKFLREQLASFAAQTYPHWSLHVSDDGSTDATRAILDAFKTQHHVTVYDGPRQGFARNFLHLTARPEIDAPYIAWSDQDDIWEPEKLARAVAWLEAVPPEIPALYGARTLYVSNENEVMYPSTLFAKPPGFRNALVQCIAGGNTMVMNRAARNLIVSAAQQDVAGHDWWAYMLVAGSGGRVFYDPVPALRYRQHPHNVLGQNVSLHARLARLRGLLAGKFQQWNDINIAALSAVRHLLTPENQIIFDRFCDARKQALAPRLWGFYKSGIYRQTLLGNVGLAVAALTNRM